MKTKLQLVLLLLTLIKGLAAKTSTVCHDGKQLARTRILSREEMSITGSFQFTLEVVAFDTCVLDSIRIINEGQFLTISYNSSNSFSQTLGTGFSQTYLLPGDTAICTISVSHSTTNLPYYPESFGFYICLHEANYSTKSYAGGKIYFTPYNSVEIWDRKDFRALPRVWATKVSPAPARVAIARTAIPVSTKPSNPQIQYDWQKYYQLTRVAGLPYLIQMAAVHPDTIKFYKRKDSIEVWQGKHNGQLSKTLIGNDFNGTITGRLRANYDVDGNDLPNVNMGLQGVHVAAYDEDVLIDDKLGETHTNANGEFTISYISWQAPLEGSTIELFVQYWAENLDYDIEVEIDPYWSWVPVLFNVAPETDHTWIGDVGTSYNGNLGDIGIEGIYEGSFKTLNWAYKAYKFCKDKLGNYSGGFTRSLDILTEYNGNASHFNPVYGNRINLIRGNDHHEGNIWHEFGHFFMYQLQDGNYTDIGWFEDYDREYASGVNISWSEGWADGFAMMVDVNYRDYDGESELRRMGCLDCAVWNFEDRSGNYYKDNSGFQSIYHIACALMDVYDAQNAFPQNVSNIVYNDQNTNQGYQTKGEIDDVGLTFHEICGPLYDGRSASYLVSNIGDYFRRLNRDFIDPCLSRKVQKVFILNGVNVNKNDYINANEHLSTDNISITRSVNNSDFICDVDLFASVANSYNIGTPQYGSTFPFYLKDNLTISNGAVLYMYGNKNAGTVINGASIIPTYSQTMIVKSYNQNLTINNTSALIIGGNNTVEYTLNCGSILKLNNGSSMNISNGSTLIVENGSKLIYENGANVDLNSATSKIIVKPGGQIILGSNATFNYRGSGTIIFETATGNNVPYVATTNSPTNPTARFMLNSGNFGNKTKKLLQVTGGQTANIDPSLYLFAVLNGNIALDANSRINVITQCQMQNVDIVASTPNSAANRHRGIIFNGYSENIYNVSVSDATTGITALNYYGGGDIYISQFSATRCGTALQISGKGAKVYSANITNCDLGVFLDKMDRQTYFYNPTITACKRGMYGSENNLNVIELDQPNIYNNIYGVDALKTIFTARCGKIYNNSSNIATNRSSFEGANVYLRANSNLYLDPNLRPSSGSMEMRNIRALSILQDKSAWLSPQLSGGRNNLWTPIDYSIYGTLTDKNIASGVNVNKPSNLNLWNYVYTSSGWTSVAPVDHIDYDVKYTALGNMQSYKILYYDMNPLAAFQSCYSAGAAPGGSTGGGGGVTNDRFTGNITEVITPISDLPITNPTPKGEIVHKQISNGYNYCFSEGANYYEAVNAFTDALQTKFIQSDLDNWTDAIHIVNAQMAEALSMGLANGSIDRYDASGASYSQSITDVFAVQDKLLLDFAEDAVSKYKINNIKAYIYRMISERETCIALLRSITADVPSDFTDIHNRAICQITNELNYINGTITIDDLESASCPDPSGIDPSWQPFIGEELSDEFVLKNNDSTGVNNVNNQPIKLFPNPSSTGLTTLHFYSESGMQYEISLFDLLGRKVLQLNGVGEKENNINLNISELPAGSYIVKLNSNKITQTKNLIITK